MRTPVTVGVIGLGAWGPKLARVFDELPGADLRWICDHNAAAMLRVKPRFPRARTTSDLEHLLDDEALDAVVVATPPGTHHELARRALEAEKHVLVETPLALEADQAEELVRLAEANDRQLMCGHVTLFHPGVQRLKALIERGHLGDIYYFHSSRLGASVFHSGENVVWDLGSHDVATALYLLGDEPVEVWARGDCFADPEIVDVAFCSLSFATGISAHLHLSGIEPRRTRRISVVGSEQMAVLDELETERTLTLYDRSRSLGTSLGDSSASMPGDIVSLRLPADEPLWLECEHFVASVRSSAETIAGPRESSLVVGVLEALDRSLQRPGAGGTPADVPAPAVLRLPVRAKSP